MLAMSPKKSDIGIVLDYGCNFGLTGHFGLSAHVDLTFHFVPLFSLDGNIFVT